MSRIGAKIQRERAQEARAARRLIRELLPPPPPSPEPAPERLGGAEPLPAPDPAFAHPFEPAIAVLLVLILVALFGAVSALGSC
jgi:hypothetical protein